VELTQRLYELWEAEGVLWISNVDFAVWPGPVAAIEEEEEMRDGDNISALTRSRRADLS
jgi:hypothetical protein